jgi:translation elongation factor EF-1beta
MCFYNNFDRHVEQRFQRNDIGFGRKHLEIQVSFRGTGEGGCNHCRKRVN